MLATIELNYTKNYKNISLNCYISIFDIILFKLYSIGIIIIKKNFTEKNNR